MLLVPHRSPVASRYEVSTRSRFTPSIELAVPVVSANMDTITESEMAIAIAQLGGLGVVHRFLPIERQAAAVARVKRFLGYVIEDPHWVGPERTIADARAETARRGVTGLLVATPERELLGVLTARDLRPSRTGGPSVRR